MIRRFARPYARAIMDVAGSPEKAATLRDELTQFEQIRKSSRDLQEMYANPGIDFESKKMVTSEIAKRLPSARPPGVYLTPVSVKFGLSPLTIRVLDVLIQNRRINDLKDIIDGLATMIRDANGTVAVEVRSASELSVPQRQSLGAMLEGKVGTEVELNITVDPTLIGGFVAKIGSEVYDASVSGKIEKFRASLA